jgi:ubiquitin-like modifier-activating enzyme 5
MSVPSREKEYGTLNSINAVFVFSCSQSFSFSAASLPTTMAITAGCLVQNALKRLLHFGSVSNFVGYDALNDFFPRYTLLPNPECDNRHCREWAARRVGVNAEANQSATVAEVDVVHEDGDCWGIEVDADVECGASTVEQTSLANAGLRRQYEMEKTVLKETDKVVVGENESVDDLAAQFNAL